MQLKHVLLSASLLLVVAPFTLLARPTQVEIRYPAGTQAHDPQRDYFLSVLRLAAEQALPDYDITLKPIDVTMYQARQLMNIQSGVIDISWTMTTEAREQRFAPIRIPLMRGLLGYRVGIIKRANQPFFDLINNTEQLKTLRTLQGHDWPDTQILMAHQFNVGTTSNYQRIHQLLLEDKYHFFPRGVLEAYKEVALLDDVRYSVDTRHLLVYPTAVYFFTRHEDSDVHRGVTLGLQRAIADGSFQTLFLSYQQHKQNLEKVNPKKRVVHCLTNPLAPASLNNTPAPYWYWNDNPDFNVCPRS